MKVFKWCVLALVLIAPIVFYVAMFHGHSFSEDPSAWGSFGDYFGGIYSVIVTILAVYLANLLSKKNDSSKRKKDAIEEITEQIKSIEKGDSIDIRRVNRFLRLVHSSRLYFPDTFEQSLLDLYDEFIKNKDTKNLIDTHLVEDVRKQLKRLYES